MQKLLGDKLYCQIRHPEKVTEIRIRIGHPVLIKYFSDFTYLSYIPEPSFLQTLIQKATKFSPYAYEDEISNGFIHYSGGIRIGIAGKGLRLDNKKLSIPYVSSVCIRFPHEIIGASERLGDFFTDYENTLIISPPFCGKTTLIRDMARILSDRYDTLYIDERSELCADNGSLKTGKRADIIQGIPKKYLYENVIRAMSPEIVVCDELFSTEDFFSVGNFIRAGIKCLASFHAADLDSVPAELKKLFQKFILLSSRPKVGTVVSIRRTDD